MCVCVVCLKRQDLKAQSKQARERGSTKRIARYKEQAS